MKKFFLAAWLFAAGSLQPAHSEQRHVQLDTGTGLLEGTLLEPENNVSQHLALLVAGSGPTDRNGNNPQMTNNSLKLLAKALANKGIATLRYDKRGVGASTLAGHKESDLRFKHYIEDVQGWVDYLKLQQPARKVTIIGHSEGSLLGMIASQNDKVEKFISIAGAGESADNIIREQLKAQPTFVIEQSTPILDQLVLGHTVENIPAFLNALFRKSVQPYMISWFRYDPQIEIAKLKKPVLILQGTTDIQVSEEDANKLALANPQAVKVVIHGMNHILKEAPLERQANIATYNQPDLPLKSELTKAISDFILLK